MKRFIFFFITAVLLLIPVTCKMHIEPFTITGIWLVEQTITDNSGKTKTMNVKYLFYGDEIEGEVDVFPPLSAGFHGGHYRRSGDQIDFRFSAGRGILWSTLYYSAELYPNLNMMIGTVFRKSSLRLETEITGTGTFVARKEEKEGKT